MSTPAPRPSSLPPAAPTGAWAALLDAANDLMALLDADGRVLWVNAAFTRHSGYRTTSVLGRNMPAVLGAGDDSAPAWDGWAVALQGEAATEIDILPWHDGTGEARHGRATLKPLPPGDESGARWLFVLQDTTATQRLEAERTAAVERLHTAQEFGRLAMWERDLPLGDGRWDTHMFRLWGFDPDEPVPSFDEIAKRIHPDERPGELYRASALQIGKYSKRYRLVWPDGDIRHVHAQWEVRGNADGTPRLLSGVMVDDTETYRLAESLTQASGDLNLAVDLGNIAIWRHDLKTNRVFHNHVASLVLGVVPRPEGYALEEIRALIHPEDVGRMIESAEESLRLDRPVDVEARYRHADGRWRHVMTRRVVHRDAEGRPFEFMGIALDVTEQVKRNREAGEAAKRLQVAAAAAGLGLWSRDPEAFDGKWNPQMFEITGRPPSLGAPTRREWVEEIIHADDRAHMRRAQDELLASEDTTIEHQYRIVRPDGDVRWLVNRARHERRDGESRLFGITIDVTERVRTEAALHQANERIALAVHGAGIGTWERDVRHDVVMWDPQMYVLRGLAPDAEPSDTLRFELAHPDDLERILALNERSVRERTMCHYEFRSRMPDGSYRWFASRSVPIVDASGEVVRQIGVNWDVHERVTAEAERQDKLVAQRESQAKSEFLARMSHELRTPLNAVLGFTQLLQLAPKVLDDEQRVKLGHIQSAGQHLLSLINDVLDLSSLESGQLKLDLQPVPLAQVLSEALALIEPGARRAGVKVQVKAVDGVLHADRIRVRQVLINLLSNAVKYNRPRGKVSVSARRAGHDLLVRVKDTGRGMTRQQLAHLFEPFNRLGMEREGIEGSGMGLAVVKGLVERMEGSIAVTSEPGVGTTFELRLPRHAGDDTADEPGSDLDSVLEEDETDGPDAPHEGGAAVDARGKRRGQVLYIEDNPVNVLLVEELVRTHAGLSIESQGTGHEGVRRALVLQPDLILIDMQLPDIHGFEVLRRLRSHPATANIPCIALSANAMPEDIAKATAAGFNDYWTKPIHFPNFLAALDRVFPPA